MSEEQDKSAVTGLNLRVISSVLVIALALFLLRYVAHVLLVSFAGILLAVLLDGVSGWISSRIRLSRLWVLSLMLVFLVLLFVLLGWVAGPRIVDQFIQLLDRIPQALSRLESILRESDWGRRVVEMVSRPQQLLPLGQNVLGRLTGVFSTTIGGITTMILILFVGIHVAYRPRVYKAGLLHLVPLSRRTRAEAVLDETSRALKLWLAARFTSMAVVGVLTVIGLAIADIPLALSLGLIAALLSFIPYLGPILSVIPAILVALAGDPGKVIWVLVVYGVVQFVESYLATPLIEQEATSVPAALLIVVQVLLAVMAGALGIFLASPLAVAATVLLQMLYVQDVLKDRIKTLAER